MFVTKTKKTTHKNPKPSKKKPPQNHQQKNFPNPLIVIPDKDPIIPSKSIRKFTTLLLHGILGRIRLKCLKDNTSLQSWGKASWWCSSWFVKCILFPQGNVGDIRESFPALCTSEYLYQDIATSMLIIQILTGLWVLSVPLCTECRTTRDGDSWEIMGWS